jgi:hypothetical protein
MEDNLEVYFCEICSESIPLKDLETRTARQVNGKVIGACCLQAFAPKPDKTGTSPASLTALGVVFLAGLASATIWLEYRLTSTTGELDGRLNTISSSVGVQNERWGSLEGQLEKFADKDAQASMSTRLGQLEGAVDATKTVVDQLHSGQRGSKVQLGELEDRVGTVRDLQKTAGTHLQAIAAELQQLSRDVAALAAMPRNTGKRAAEADTEHPLGAAPAAKDTAKDTAKGTAKDRLSANLSHQVARLKDDDAGNRFEAVDQLIRSKNPRVREHLLPMLKDPDLFVRRLTAEGLGDFKHAESVSALIVALADPESIVRHTAYSSLKKLTGQKIAFDPDASAGSRKSAQRKWKEWWSKAKAGF